MSSPNSNNNNQQRRTVVKEDAPQMRSVRIQAAPVTPPMLFGRTTVGPSKAAAPTSQMTTTATTANSTPTVVDHAWKVSQLRPVPSFYRLERTHLKIGDATVQDISDRIAACLREESVSATFHNDEVRYIISTGAFSGTRLRMTQAATSHSSFFLLY